MQRDAGVKREVEVNGTFGAVSCDAGGGGDGGGGISRWESEGGRRGEVAVEKGGGE